MAGRNVISLVEATRPDYSSQQLSFAKDLIGLGLTRLTIVGLVLGKDVRRLNPAEVGSGQRLIGHLREELGYGVMDARRAQSPYMKQAVHSLEIGRAHV